MKTALRRKPDALIEEPADLDLLTPRQRDILRLVSVGHTNREIANMLQISVRTVEVHRFNLMRRLNVRNVAQLLRRAEVEADDHCRLRLLQAALAELASAGFAPKECRIEMCGTRTNNIWLIAK